MNATLCRNQKGRGVYVRERDRDIETERDREQATEKESIYEINTTTMDTLILWY